MPELHLALDPLLPLRAPAAGADTQTFGFRLRLAPDGPGLAHDDPLLQAYGARVLDVHVDDDADEPLQHEAFDPGRRLRLLPDPDAPAWVEVWDDEGVRRAGTLTTEHEAVARAALEHGLDVRAVALAERRTVRDDRRSGLVLLVHPQAFVRVDPAPEAPPRPARRRRRRVVLFADGRGEVRWWDPTATGGPVGVDELPVSPDLQGELAALRKLAASIEGHEDWMAELMRSEVDEWAVRLWRRARAELGSGWSVGFLGRGMRHPAWTPADLADDEAELPF